MTNDTKNSPVITYHTDHGDLYPQHSCWKLVYPNPSPIYIYSKSTFSSMSQPTPARRISSRRFIPKVADKAISPVEQEIQEIPEVLNPSLFQLSLK